LAGSGGELAADLKGYFGSIPKDKMMEAVAGAGVTLHPIKTRVVNASDKGG